ncbi:uncharacterized protein PHACADRAFT_28997 [Phanerochaete carnosa HHB-10118-sp]|uniref:F-box domain-containing protein n=1 Tax=Phanerochaete carnosa (strain HHB-10118-sp) TaxID=650164 RepID=K5WZT1_PHACS|nr:uncharacterized protein PHACADRAFT_28997 [Phanerochaete carnosa HHB-10118-sp]EKM56027.1 hypothetical protein PHACADRAFT_28997 [Phanerochaete carnosa HHB-10118-sp]
MSTLHNIEAGKKTLGIVDTRHPDGIRPAMRLNWDILVEIMSFSDNADASRMSRTCRTLLQAAPKILLSREAVSLCGPEQLSSFLQYMLCGRQAAELKLVMFYNEFLEIDTSINRTLTNLSRLRTIQLSDATDPAAELLKEMQAPLTGIDASFFDYVDYWFDPVETFARFRHSLRAMSLAFVRFASADIQYPHVVSLSVERCRFEDLEHIVHCFPGLHDLKLHGISFDFMVENDLEEERLSNLASQARRTWSSLHRLSGDVLGLYILGIRCRVDHVSVSCQPLNSTVDGQRLAAILADVRPTSLDIRLRLPEFKALSLAECLTPTARGP